MPLSFRPFSPIYISLLIISVGENKPETRVDTSTEAQVISRELKPAYQRAKYGSCREGGEGGMVQG
ncbi:hypothetical protein ABZP36_025673 [Zizania latifolia]